MRPSPRIIVLAAAVAAAALLVLFIQPHTSAQLTPATEAPSATTSLATSTGDASRTPPTTTRAVSARVMTTSAASITTSGVTPTTATVAIDPATSATIKVAGISHPVAVSTNETVEGAMKTLQVEGAITFTTQHYSGIGDFVESINGKVSANDQYWILYVNGKQSDTGISSTPIRAGDQIVWNYEHGY